MTLDRAPDVETEELRLTPDQIADQIEQWVAIYACALSPALAAQKLRLMAKDIEAAWGRPN